MASLKVLEFVTNMEYLSTRLVSFTVTSIVKVTTAVTKIALKKYSCDRVRLVLASTSVY